MTHGPQPWVLRGPARDRRGRSSGGREPELKIDGRLRRVRLRAVERGRGASAAAEAPAAGTVEAPAEGTHLAGDHRSRVDRAIGARSPAGPDRHADRDVIEGGVIDPGDAIGRVARDVDDHGLAIACLDGDRVRGLGRHLADHAITGDADA